MQIVQIVTRLSPAIDGVGDYALNLARQLRKDFGIETTFVVGDPKWMGDSSLEGFTVRRVTARSPDSLLSLLPNSMDRIPLLLHYVGYGYATRGCPFWLFEGLQRWKETSSNRYLATMFHEIYATGPPWTSTFWLSSLQKNLAAGLSRLSDECMTNRNGYVKILRELSQGKHTKLAALPIFSGVGEPVLELPPLADRQPRLVIFGGRNSRRRVFEKASHALKWACQTLGVEEILDVGPSTGLQPSEVGGVPVNCVGEKTAEDVSALLIDSIVGFFDYPPEFLAKSSIFAAYCAHGILPVGNVVADPVPADGLEVGKHYWIADARAAAISIGEGQIIADNAHSWYQEHDLSFHAHTFAACLTSES